MRPPSLRTAAELVADRPHGVRLRYLSGCRCVPCRAANSRYEVERSAARRRGEGAHLVDARAAREHLRMLSRRGVGKGTVSDISRISDTILHRIKLGRRLRIRATTERAILAVTVAAAPVTSLVSAGPTRRLIAALLQEGYTKTFISRQLGGDPNRRALQVARAKRVTKATALKVERLYRRVTA